MKPYRLLGFLLLVVTTLGCTASNRNTEGLNLFNQAKYDQAIQAFQNARDANPNDPDPYYNIGAASYQLGKIYQQYGQTAVFLQMLDQAEANYRQCLARNPNHPEAYRGLAVVYMERQQPGAAFQLIQNWANTNQNSPEPRIELARLYQEFADIQQSRGQTADANTSQQYAASTLQSVLQLDPNNYRALRAVGSIYEKKGDTAQALANYRRSYQSNPNQPDLAAKIAAMDNTAYNPTPIPNPYNPYNPNPSPYPASTYPGSSAPPSYPSPYSATYPSTPTSTPAGTSGSGASLYNGQPSKTTYTGNPF